MRYRMAGSGTAHIADASGPGVLCQNRSGPQWPEIEADSPPGPLCRTCAEAWADRQVAGWTDELKNRVTQDVAKWRALCRLIVRHPDQQIKPRDLPSDVRDWLGP